MSKTSRILRKQHVQLSSGYTGRRLSPSDDDLVVTGNANLLHGLNVSEFITPSSTGVISADVLLATSQNISGTSSVGGHLTTSTLSVASTATLPDISGPTIFTGDLTFTPGSSLNIPAITSTSIVCTGNTATDTLSVTGSAVLPSITGDTQLTGDIFVTGTGGITCVDIEADTITSDSSTFNLLTCTGAAVIPNITGSTNVSGGVTATNITIGNNLDVGNLLTAKGVTGSVSVTTPVLYASSAVIPVLSNSVAIGNVATAKAFDASVRVSAPSIYGPTITALNNLIARETSTFTGNVTAGSNVTINGSLYASSAALPVITNNVAIGNVATAKAFDATIRVSAPSIYGPTLTALNNLISRETTTLTGNVTAGSDVSINGALTVANGSTTTGLAVFNSGARVASGLYSVDAFEVAGATILADTAVTGPLDVIGAITTTTLNVSGVASVAGPLTTAGVSNNGGLTTATLIVNGTTTLGNTLVVTGASTFSAVNVSGALSVGGSTACDQLTCDQLVVANGATFTGSCVLEGTTTIWNTGFSTTDIAYATPITLETSSIADPHYIHNKDRTTTGDLKITVQFPDDGVTNRIIQRFIVDPGPRRVYVNLARGTTQKDYKIWTENSYVNHNAGSFCAPGVIFTCVQFITQSTTGVNTGYYSVIMG